MDNWQLLGPHPDELCVLGTEGGDDDNLGLSAV